ncbi:MAG: glycosyltransferase family 39 protein [Candidatus Omnitrophica bacterium]|nr:glycosyltransferase family 39 protein [Candidatus Omnitrophota bacterium]
MKRRTRISAAIMLSVFFLLALTSILPGRQSGTCDEIAHHIPVGTVLLDKFDLKMDTSHPPLSRYIAALLPNIFLNPVLPADKAEWRREDRGEFGREFFYKYNIKTGPDRILFLSRLAVVFVGLFSGVILFTWARELAGDKAALFSLFLYCFSPEVIAHSSLATTDMTAACFILLALYTLWKYLGNISLESAMLAGFTLGLAQLSKYTAVVLYPLYLFFVFIYPRPSGQAVGKRKLAGHLLLIILISLIVIWAGYGFSSRPILEDAMRVQEKLEIIGDISAKLDHLTGQRTGGLLLDLFVKVPLPFGEHILGILGVMRHGQLGHGTYLLGTYRPHGNILYFVTAFLIKTPIASIIFIIAGIALCLRKDNRSSYAVLSVSGFVLFAAASLSSLQLGIRYILPVYPILFIAAGRVEELLRPRAARYITYSLAAWYIGAALWIWPHYLSYFNELIGGPGKGYIYLRDSNIDWGQDLPELARYLKKNGIDEVKLDYFGMADPAYYGIKALKMGAGEFIAPGKYVYAISVNYYDQPGWVRSYHPTAMAGYSIFIYDLRSQPGKDMAQALY